MTTYRRFCCNDLLRLGTLNLKSGVSTQSMRTYMRYLAVWPGNFLVADVPGGRIAGYVFAEVAGKDRYFIGKLSVLVYASKNMQYVGKTLSKLLEDSCEKIYYACAMQRITSANNFLVINTLSELGYQMYKQHPGKLEMRKPLPRLATMFPGLRIS